MATSDYLEQRFIDLVLNGNTEFSFTSPTVYAALFTTSPLDDGSGAECTGIGYARVLAGSFSTMTGVTDGAATNLAVITYPEAGAGGWGTVSHCGLFDALTGGNLLYHGPLGAPELIDATVIPRIPIGSLTVTHA